MKISNVLLLLFLLIFLTHSINSQTIINAEKLNLCKDSLGFNFSFLYSGTQGNLISDQLNIYNSISKKGKKYIISTTGNYSTILYAVNNTILNNGFIHLRHNYLINKSLKTFEFYQLQFNEVLLLVKREIFGGGIRFNIINKKKTKFNASFGIMHEIEKLNKNKININDKENTEYIRGIISLVLHFAPFEHFKFSNVTYYEPHFSDFSDFRLLNDFNISFKLTKKISFYTIYTIRYDNEPPSVLKSFDGDLKSGLHITLSK